jgi:hypothetical protein
MELSYSDKWPEIEINKRKFRALANQRYPYHYFKCLELIRDKAYGEDSELRVYRDLILKDPFFVAYFVLGIDAANHPWVVDRCIELMGMPKTNVLYEWAREHYKTTLITKICYIIQKLLANPEERIAIFSYSRPISKGILRSVKQVFESSDILKACFPDVLYQDPEKESPKWSEDDGIVLKRSGYYSESSLEAWGLIEGMPTSKHFTGRVYDDIETDVTTSSPEMMEKLKLAYELSQNLGTAEGWHNVVGTTYHHQGLLKYLEAKKTPDGESVYLLSKHAATHDGTANGKPVLLSARRLAELKASPRTFYPQQLLDPTPLGARLLDPTLLKSIAPSDVPKNVYKFMLIDQAGVDRNREGDAWAIGVIGVEPMLSNEGLNNIYLLDLVLQPLGEAEALDEVVRMYLRNGRIIKLCVEKVSMNSTEVHVANALKVKGRHVSQEMGNLALLRPAGRSKEERIDKGLSWPLAQGKIHISTAIQKAYQDRIRTEMERFPFWHDDGIDMLSYIYDVIAEYKFPKCSVNVDEKKVTDGWDEAFEKARRSSSSLGWMTV